jgi:hypothetical protein
MATKLKSALKREVRIDGIDDPVIVKLTEDSVEMSLPGFKIKLFTTWTRIVEKAMLTPKNVPSFLEGRPHDLLKYQSHKIVAKSSK